MIQKTSRKEPMGDRPFLSQTEINKKQSEDREFSERCRHIFRQVYPKLVSQHPNWFIHIEPESGDYFIDPNEEISFQKARSQHSTARIMAMRLNQTGTCGKI